MGIPLRQEWIVYGSQRSNSRDPNSPLTSRRHETGRVAIENDPTDRNAFVFQFAKDPLWNDTSAPSRDTGSASKYPRTGAKSATSTDC